MITPIDPGYFSFEVVGRTISGEEVSRPIEIVNWPCLQSQTMLIPPTDSEDDMDNSIYFLDW